MCVCCMFVRQKVVYKQLHYNGIRVGLSAQFGRLCQAFCVQFQWQTVNSRTWPRFGIAQNISSAIARLLALCRPVYFT